MGVVATAKIDVCVSDVATKICVDGKAAAAATGEFLISDSKRCAKTRGINVVGAIDYRGRKPGAIEDFRSRSDSGAYIWAVDCIDIGIGTSGAQDDDDIAVEVIP